MEDKYEDYVNESKKKDEKNENLLREITKLKEDILVQRNEKRVFFYLLTASSRKV